MNAIQLLKEDHGKLRALLAELESTTSRGVKTRSELLAKIGRELRAHTRIEEEIFYPAFKAAGEKSDDRMYFEAKEEHRAVELLVLPDLEKTDPASECFGGRTKVLKELIEHHAGEEEKDMFPRARKLLGVAELDALGASMEARKRELLAGEPGIVAKVAGAVVDAIAPRDEDELPGVPAAARHRADGRDGAHGRSSR